MAEREPDKVSAEEKQRALESLTKRDVPHEVSGDRVTVEFRIQDLVNKLGGFAAGGHCAGCLGCTGCKN